MYVRGSRLTVVKRAREHEQGFTFVFSPSQSAATHTHTHTHTYTHTGQFRSSNGGFFFNRRPCNSLGQELGSFDIRVAQRTSGFPLARCNLTVSTILSASNISVCCCKILLMEETVVFFFFFCRWRKLPSFFYQYVCIWRVYQIFARRLRSLLRASTFHRCIFLIWFSRCSFQYSL